MADFTKQELEQIDVISRSLHDGEAISADDAILWGRFEAYKATRDAKLLADIEQGNALINAEIAELRAANEIAVANMREMHEAAMTRYENSLRLIEV